MGRREIRRKELTESQLIHKYYRRSELVSVFVLIVVITIAELIAIESGTLDAIVRINSLFVAPLIGTAIVGTFGIEIYVWKRYKSRSRNDGYK